MNVLDLFSGIGGFSLGLERAGMQTVAFCEIEPYCRAVLRKHWPTVPIFEDVRTLTAADVPRVDVICGGFPCQDISNAGKRAGIRGERSGLWKDFARLIGDIRPHYVIVENVAALLGRGIERVLGDLSEIGYDAEWKVISAADAGAPHIRERVWIVAYPRCKRYESERISGVSVDQEGEMQREMGKQRIRTEASNGSQDVGNANRSGRSILEKMHEGRGFQIEGAGNYSAIARSSWWDIEPDVGRVAHGIPARVDRLKGLGNAVVPQIPEIIGRAIMQAEGLNT